MKTYKDVVKTLEIYEYYDGPLSSLVEFNDGSKAIIEVRDWNFSTKELWEVVIFVSDFDVKYLKENQVDYKEFIFKKCKENNVILWHYQENSFDVLNLGLQEVFDIFKDMSDGFIFKDTSKEFSNLI